MPLPWSTLNPGLGQQAQAGFLAPGEHKPAALPCKDVINKLTAFTSDTAKETA